MRMCLLVLAGCHRPETTAALLLDRGVDQNGTAASGSPLTGAAFKTHPAIARLLPAA